MSNAEEWIEVNLEENNSMKNDGTRASSKSAELTAARVMQWE